MFLVGEMFLVGQMFLVGEIQPVPTVIAAQIAPQRGQDFGVRGLRPSVEEFSGDLFANSMRLGAEWPGCGPRNLVSHVVLFSAASDLSLMPTTDRFRA